MNNTKYYRTAKDFPIPGVDFFDFQKTFDNPAYFREIVGLLAQKAFQIKEAESATYLACLDARGFIYGPSVAQVLDMPFCLIRKQGKLAPPVVGMSDSEGYSTEYSTEYSGSSDQLHLEMPPIKNQRMIILDDILATGGTINAAHSLIEKAGSVVVGAVVLKTIELSVPVQSRTKVYVYSVLR